MAFGLCRVRVWDKGYNNVYVGRRIKTRQRPPYKFRTERNKIIKNKRPPWGSNPRPQG